MADLTYNVDVNTTAGVRNLDKLAQSVNQLNTKLNSLKANSLDNLSRSADKLAGNMRNINVAAVVAAFGTAITASIRFADAIKDIADATQLSNAAVLGFTDSIIENGGSAEKAEQIMYKFIETIGEAADGSQKAQLAFSKVGVTLNDLRTLSEQDLLKKTITGLSQIEDVGERARLKTELLSKAARSVNLQGLASGLNDSINRADQYSQAIDAAAAAQGAFERAVRTTQYELLKSIQPLTEYLGKLSGKEIDELVAALGRLITKLIPLAGHIDKLQYLAQMIIIVADAVKYLSSIEWPWWMQPNAKLGGGVVELLAKIPDLIDKINSKKITPLESGAGAGRGSYQGYDPKADAENKGKAQRRAVKEAGDFQKRMAEMNAAIERNLALKNADEIKAIRINSSAEIASAQRQIDEDVLNEKYSKEQGERLKAAKAQEINAKAETEIAKIVKGRNDDLAKFGQELKNQTKEYSTQLNDLQQRYQFETNLIGLSEDEVEQRRALNDLATDYNNKLKDIENQISRLNTEQANDPSNEQIKEKIRLLQGQRDQLTQFYDKAKAELPGYINNLQTARLLEEDRKRTLENITKAIEAQIARQQTLGEILVAANDKLKETEFQGAQQRRSPYEQQLANIQEQARTAALEAGRVFSASFEGMDLSAAQAEELASGLDQIAQKYKLIADEQTKQLEYSRSWEAGWKDAFDKYMDNATNAATRAGEVFSSITRNMENAIDNFVETGKFSFKDFARSIIQDLIKIELKAQATQLLKMVGGSGGIFSAIGSLFGFANGGTPPINKPSIVGEKGPEIFVPKQAGTIIPNHAVQGAMNQIGQGAVQAPITNNYITNNISAIDAKSVAQLFAENRKTLLGTVEMARKEMPYSNR